MKPKIKAQLKRMLEVVQGSEEKPKSRFHFLLGPARWAMRKVRHRQKPSSKPLDNSTPEETTPPSQKKTSRRSSKSSIEKKPIRSGVPVRPLEISVTSLAEISSGSSRSTLSYYSVEPYCVICRKEFPVNIDEDDMDSSEEGLSSAWQCNTMAICPSPVSGPYTSFLAMEFDLKKHQEKLQSLLPSSPIGLPQHQTIMADIYLKRKKTKIRDVHIHRRRDAYAVHRTCWNLTRMYTKHPHTNNLVYQFGLATKDLVRTLSNENTWAHSIRDLTPFLASLNQEVGIAKLLYCLSCSPAEIENTITELSPNNLLSSVIAFVRSTLPLLLSISPHKSLQPEILSLSPPFLHLATQWTDIYSHTYLSNLATLADAPEAQKLAVPILPIRGIQFEIGAYGLGIKALKFLYKDGSESTWLGKVSDRQVMTVLGKQITGLRIERDALKITRIYLVAEKTWYMNKADTEEHKAFSHRRKIYMLQRSNSNSPFGEWRARDQESTEKRHCLSWRHRQKLQVNPREKVTGITVYYHAASVMGIATHGVSTNLIGSRGPTSLALYLPLCTNDFLTSVWTLRSHTALQNTSESGKCPPIILVTALGRTRVCYPAWNAQSSFKKPEWTPISNDLETPIQDIFNDGTVNRDGSMRNIGIVKDHNFTKAECDLVKKPTIAVPTTGCIPHQKEWRDVFVSFAKFEGVMKIEARKRGVRYFGLLVYYSDGNISVFGQWDASFPGEISTIYEEIQGPIQEICFKYSPQSGDGWKNCVNEKVKSFVSGIRVVILGGTAEAGEEYQCGETFHWTEFSKPLAWWFTWYADCIQEWKGEVEEAVVREEVQKELFLNPGLSLPEHEGDPGLHCMMKKMIRKKNFETWNWKLAS